MSDVARIASPAMAEATLPLSEPARGRDATQPLEIPPRGWTDVLWRVKDEISDDRVGLIAAGTTFYLLLALFPALAAFVSLYGFVADPVTVADQIAFLGGLMPSAALSVVRDQLLALATADPAKLSFGFVFGFLVALWSANNGVKTLFEAMNVAYDETGQRGFIRLNLITLGFTAAGILVAILMIVAVGVVPAVLATVGLGGATETIISLLRWPVLLVVIITAIAVLYRYGPSRTRAAWRWVLPGSILAAVTWVAASILFSWYLGNFADYNATYGSLGAVIGFMMWTWISIFIFIAGAELNAEMEHQTVRDSTVGPAKPLGARGATMADTIGKRFDQPHPGRGHARAPAGRRAVVRSPPGVSPDADDDPPGPRNDVPNILPAVVSLALFITVLDRIAPKLFRLGRTP